ncbi:MAG: hypothetical protein RMJ07_05585 [Nitrososphaerota archaeon]|nr:hypothetical protein [Nitrososphaerota archaeon]
MSKGAVDLDFRKEFRGWIVSEKCPVCLSIDEDCGLRIVSGTTFWEISYKPLLLVNSDEHYTIELESKHSFKERSYGPRGYSFFMMKLEALDADTRPVNVRFDSWRFGDPGEPFIRLDLGSWRSGEIALTGRSDWIISLGFFKPFPGTRYMRLTLRGMGKGEVYVRRITIKRGVPVGVNLSSKPFLLKSVPKPRLLRHISVGDYMGKLIRIGDLNGDGVPEIVTAQNERIGPGNIYRQITCLTAINLDGSILWQIGEPDAENFEALSDLPVHVADINDDGRDEVITCMNFKILVMNGEDGRIINSATTPRSRKGGGYMEGPETLFDRILGDCIVTCNLRGAGDRKDLILKDRYNNMWAYTVSLEPLWDYAGKLIHSPSVFDVDRDGRDEVFAGDALLDHDGSVMWQLDAYDHCDSAVFYEYHGKILLAIANQCGGFYFLDALSGRILRKWHIGHAQVLSAANFDPKYGYPLICGQTFHGGLHQFLFSPEGEILFSHFDGVYGWVPVNWTGDGVELIAAPQGLFDCYGNLVVEFPNRDYVDSRWGSKVYVWNFYGDCRDEVIVWNEKSIVIYTQEDNPRRGGILYSPIRNVRNQTFYGNIRSEPDWTSL